MISERKARQYMEWAIDGARVFSTCSRRQYMAIILGSDGRVIGTGYNGGPSGFAHCNVGGCSRAASDTSHGSAYSNCIAIHAEANAIIHSDRTARAGGTLIINGPPCMDCAKLIAGSGVAEVVYQEDSAYTDWMNVYNFLRKAGLKLIKVDRATAVASNCVRGESCSDVGCGAEEEMVVAVLSTKSTAVGIIGAPWRLVGTDASIRGNALGVSS